ncbi:MAG: amidohydrolase family protein [Desulfobacteraceae bacterium]
MIDGHAHLFHPKVIGNVQKRAELVQRIRLNTEDADQRNGTAPLEASLNKNKIRACLLLPTAPAHDVGRVNDALYETLCGSNLLYPAGTLHPDYNANRAELLKFRSRNIKGIKLCSFSQRFALDASATLDMFKLIQTMNIEENSGFFVVLDTLSSAHHFFGSQPEHTTTPKLLGKLVRHFSGITFIAAHMGGLAASYNDITTHLPPSKNLFLDTSNAAHVLTAPQFISLLERHGPEHVVFGTDWPWFIHDKEIDTISHLLEQAGFDAHQQKLVFSANMSGLMGI